MSGRVALLDVNVLLALFDSEHVHHEIAHDWFADERVHGWATCPITENGFVRITVALSPPDARLPAATVIDQLQKFCGTRGHHFWPDSVSLRDPAIFDTSFVASPKQLTDVYLLGVAKKLGGRLATFDRTIPLNAVVGATPKLLEIIATDE